MNCVQNLEGLRGLTGDSHPSPEFDRLSPKWRISVSAKRFRDSQMGDRAAIENSHRVPTKSTCLSRFVGVIWRRLSEDRHLPETQFSCQPAPPQGAICCSKAGRTSSSFHPPTAIGHYAMLSNPGRSDLPGFLHLAGVFCPVCLAWGGQTASRCGLAQRAEGSAGACSGT